MGRPAEPAGPRRAAAVRRGREAGSTRSPSEVTARAERAWHPCGRCRPSGSSIRASTSGSTTGSGARGSTGCTSPRNARDELAAGEILLGHPDLTGAPEPYPPLGRDGSYLVIRQLVQDVEGFWSALRSAVGRRPRRSVGGEDERALARRDARSRRRRRRPRRRRRTTSAYRDDRRRACGARSARTSAGPTRVTTSATSAEHSIGLVKRHRLLRRGRAFGTRRGARDVARRNGPGRAGRRAARRPGRERRARPVLRLPRCEPGAAVRVRAADVAEQPEASPACTTRTTRHGPPYPRPSGAAGFTFTAPGPLVNHRIELPGKYVHCVGGGLLLPPGARGARVDRRGVSADRPGRARPHGAGALRLSGSRSPARGGATAAGR